jgi:cobalt-zinc-cadmium efflux system outer membrane protein
MTRLGFLFVAVAIALGASLDAQTPQPPAAAGPVTLDALERIALETHPSLAAARARADAARARATQAATWPNPTIGFSGEELKSGGDPRGEYGFFVEQPIRLGGKLRLSRAVFERAAERDDAAVERQRAYVLTRVRQAYYEVLIGDRRIEVQERLAALVSEAVGVTAQLFNVGAADRPDFLESEVAARRVALAVTAARNRAFAARAQLAAVVGDPALANRPLSGSIDTPLPEIERDVLLQQLIEASPQLRAARAEAARTEAMIAAARRETFPDLFVRVGGAYNRERGELTGRPIGWEGALEAGVTIPLFNRNAGAVQAARADQARAAADIRQLELTLRARYADEFADYLTAIRETEAYRDEILPRAEEAYQLYLSRYRAMAASYPQVLVTQRSLLELTAEYLSSLDRAWRSALTLQGLLAGDSLSPMGTDVTDVGRPDTE